MSTNERLRGPAANRLPEPKPHEHVMSEWLSYSRTEEYRHCHIKGCPESEMRKAVVVKEPVSPHEHR